MMPESSVKRSL